MSATRNKWPNKMHTNCPKCGKALAPTPNINASLIACSGGHVFTSVELMKARPATEDDKAVQRAASAIRASRL